MSAAHTQGPLQVGNFDKRKLFTCSDNGPAEVATTLTQANARRLAACWNACDGLSTEFIEKVAEQRIANQLVTFSDLARQRDELLEALESFLRAPSVGSNGPGSVTLVVQEFNLRAARAAIAKAKGGAA